MARFTKSITNNETGESKYLTANSEDVLNEKIHKVYERWENEKQIREGQSSASEKTKTAQNRIRNLNRLLLNTIENNYTFNWDDETKKENFPDYIASEEPVLEEFLSKKFILYFSFLSFIPFIQVKIQEAKKIAKDEFDDSHTQWEKDEEDELKKYHARKDTYIKKQQEHNDTVAQLKQDYTDAKSPGVEYYYKKALGKIEFPVKNSIKNIHFKEEGKILVLNLLLPNPEDIPKSIDYKYIKTSDKIVENIMKKKDHDMLYESTIYQLVFSYAHIVFQLDTFDSVDLLVINGIVNYISKKTGHKEEKYILSIQIEKNSFLKLNLCNIVPIECFRYLKGLNAGFLVELNPVKPIINYSTEDDRFIEADNVLDTLDETNNLASMDWQKFEVLIRDILSKEFEKDGCKIEVTQASRDDGIDAIAFDDDTIRGGKYVIQAKRYNIVTPISAVRELDSVVRQEGAVKGILVTTSHFGADAYEFVKNKPLALLDGSNLLHLFSKHGYNMTINTRSNKHKLL